MRCQWSGMESGLTPWLLSDGGEATTTPIGQTEGRAGPPGDRQVGLPF